jgi:hypothetical protein
MGCDNWCDITHTRHSLVVRDGGDGSDMMDRSG